MLVGPLYRGRQVQLAMSTAMQPHVKQKSLAGPLTKSIIFIVVTALATAILGLSIASTGPNGTVSYNAVFTDVTGLTVGSDVDIAGVRIGQVNQITVVDRNLARVSFSTESGRPLPASVTATIKYLNLVGQRYINLQQGAGPVDQTLPAGATIPLAQTTPALNLTDLFNGFQPLLQALSPNDVNRLSGEIIQVFQGQGPTVGSLVAHIGSLTTTLAAKDKVIDDVIGNLNAVLKTVNSRGSELSDLVTTLQQLVIRARCRPAADRQRDQRHREADHRHGRPAAGHPAPAEAGHHPARPAVRQPGRGHAHGHHVPAQPADQDDRDRPAGLLRVLAQLLPVRRHAGRSQERLRRPAPDRSLHHGGEVPRMKRMKSMSERNPIAVGLAGLAILVVVALLAFNANNLPIIGGGTTYTALFTEDAGLNPGNEVRVAGVTVGKVTGVALDGNRVKVSFRVKGAWVGNASTVSIQIKTLLGDKYLALDPLGTGPQPPAATIPATRTASPFDVTQAFQQFGSTVEQLNTKQFAQSLEAISGAFRNTPPYVHRALTGLSALSETIASKDVQLARLFAGTRQITQTLSSEDSEFRALLGDGNLLLGELRQRQQAIHAMLTGTEALATQLSGLVSDNQANLAPTLRSLDQVTTVLENNQANLRKALALAGPYYSLLGNTLGNGRWFDTYLCGLIPKAYSPPAVVPAKGCIPPKPGGGG